MADADGLSHRATLREDAVAALRLMRFADVSTEDAARSAAEEAIAKIAETVA